jgi:hypothetical protein
MFCGLSTNQKVCKKCEIEWPTNAILNGFCDPVIVVGNRAVVLQLNNSGSFIDTKLGDTYKAVEMFGSRDAVVGSALYTLVSGPAKPADGIMATYRTSSAVINSTTGKANATISVGHCGGTHYCSKPH